jgi:hypothetical protein
LEPVENAENAQEEENSPLLIADRNDAFVLVNKHKMMYLDPKDADTDHGNSPNGEDFPGTLMTGSPDGTIEPDR